MSHMGKWHWQWQGAVFRIGDSSVAFEEPISSFMALGPILLLLLSLKQKTQGCPLPKPLQSSIDQALYLNVTGDGMVACVHCHSNNLAVCRPSYCLTSPVQFSPTLSVITFLVEVAQRSRIITVTHGLVSSIKSSDFRPRLFQPGDCEIVRIPDTLIQIMQNPLENNCSIGQEPKNPIPG
ncbi:hypothetical protein V6N11_012097 [Hibiscus sabdariffa]|uniref:Uncharacterized protein n=1 Tax=Hibiscus sabdariffa TaxID=183260 RepID=A0ABR2QA46_9ROSI